MSEPLDIPDFLRNQENLANERPKMRICWERGMFWHVDCKEQRHSAVMREITETKIECLACGKIGTYPIGSAGEVCCDEVVSTAQ